MSYCLKFSHAYIIDMLKTGKGVFMMEEFKRASLSDQIFDYIKRQIDSGVWKPGEKIPSENELAKDLGVSRMSLRSGIKKANVLGLTETRTGEGTFVKKFSMGSYFKELYDTNILSWNANDLNDLFTILQIGSARISIINGLSEKHVSKLEGELEKMVEAAGSSDLERFHDADLSFHREVCSLAENEMLMMIFGAIESLINERIKENVRRSIEINGGFDLILSHHRDVFDAIKNKDISKLT